MTRLGISHTFKINLEMQRDAKKGQNVNVYAQKGDY